MERKPSSRGAADLIRTLSPFAGPWLRPRRDIVYSCILDGSLVIQQHPETFGGDVHFGAGSCDQRTGNFRYTQIPWRLARNKISGQTENAHPLLL